MDTVDSLGQALSSGTRALIQKIGDGAAPPLLARIEVQEGELLEFYEIKPGVIVVSGAGKPPSARRTRKHVSEPIATPSAIFSVRPPEARRRETA